MLAGSVLTLFCQYPSGGILFIYFSDLCLQVFRKAFDYQVIRVIDHITKLLAGEVAICVHGIPVFFIHMESWFYFGMFFAELYGPFGVALYVEMGTIGNTDEQEYLFANFKYQSILAKG